MKTSQLRQSNYIKKEDCDPPMDVTIDGVREENVGLEEEEKMRWVLYFRELKKGLILNVENGELLEEITGSDDSDNWMGQRVQLWADPKVKFGGKKIGGVRIRRVGGYPADTTQPHPNEVRNAEERQKLATKGYGNAEPRPEDEEKLPF